MACFFNFQTEKSIRLNLLKTSSNRRSCTFPTCARQNGLHDISHSLRLKAFKNRIYIPNRSRVCVEHMSGVIWDNFQGNNRTNRFTANQINEMIKFFRDSMNILIMPGDFSMRPIFIDFMNMFPQNINVRTTKLLRKHSFSYIIFLHNFVSTSAIIFSGST